MRCKACIKYGYNYFLVPVDEKPEYDRGCTISLSGKHNWDDVDQRAKELNLIRSRYVSYAIDREIDGKDKMRNREVAMFGLILLVLLALFLQILGVL